ncbi:unnamed protein product [Porites evermanni]|uniref:Cilia- and flagella-associated protein HOATZ n=1 Tax=Porites evermanni TaxID=104178 RepID=A0ABN8LZH7_9CNID|nr:unnamed protein product [Porites evermanni]
MANEVTFSGSSAETIELAKSFWKSIEPPPAPKSTLFVSGINHRLPTASAIHNENILLVNNATGTKLDSTEEETNPSKLFVKIGTSFILFFVTSLRVLVSSPSDQISRSVVNDGNFLGLQRHLEDAKERKEREEAEYIQKMTSHREEVQQTLAQRKAERLKKEEISRRRQRDDFLDMESSEEDEEAAEAMAELDRFDEILKQKEAF